MNNFKNKFKKIVYSYLFFIFDTSILAQYFELINKSFKIV